MITSVSPLRAIGAFLLVLSAQSAMAGQKPYPPNSTVTTGSGVVLACPAGDGDLLSAKGLTISATIKEILGNPLVGVPATDFWLLGCGNEIAVCTSSPFTSGSTDVNGHIVLDGRLAMSGCDNSGLRLVVQGIIFPDCLPIQTRSPDLKASAGGCPAETICPDGRVDLADFSYFATHYPSPNYPQAAYSACGDIVEPYGGSLGLADLTGFSAHLTGTHACAGYRVNS